MLVFHRQTGETHSAATADAVSNKVLVLLGKYVTQILSWILEEKQEMNELEVTSGAVGRRVSCERAGKQITLVSI